MASRSTDARGRRSRPLPRAPKDCSDPSCTNTKPCPIHDKPWAGSSRRDRLRSRSGGRQQKLSRFVIARDEGRCHVCGDYGADETDHVVPLAEGGPDDVSNMKAIHSKPCHVEKTQREAQRARHTGTGG